MFTHPEVRSHVIREFRRMRSKNANASGDLLWSMSRDYCFAVFQADTQAFKAKYGI